ncbi:SDR family oxidoreductase [Lentilitoribacter sp. Alg239-R112]|uniref:SDR family oxidoreductase n=1 Tax=Lentilitoribacter sp. Alg239-R112 TaxID=2305987 RepID=UPI001FCED0FA|nr:SDR family oxidoreductase [Lentilitoribacter sp. Alg239-R112]
MNLKHFDLSPKNALITGAAGLLGYEHAFALLECGSCVILTDISQQALNDVRDKLLSNFPEGRILTYLMDVSDPNSIQNIGRELAANSISIDILVNNAAIDPKVTEGNSLIESSRLENFPLEQWNMQISVGLTGAFLCCQEFGPQMAKNNHGGVILNIASDLSVFAPDQRLYRKDSVSENLQPVKPVTYSVIKTGLIGLTRYMATYWTDQNIRCNALSPGGVFNGQGEDFVQKLSKLIPMGRMAEHDEYRAAVQFLCSDASSYMNGQNIVIDGGRSAW